MIQKQERYTTDSALNTKFGSRTATEKQLLQDLQTAIGSIIDTGKLADFDEKRKRQQKWTANAILKLMEESTILGFASTYKPASSKPDNKELELESYVKGLHDHLLKEVNRRLRDINIFTKHAKCPETGSFFERIQSKGSHNELEQLLKKNVREVTLEPLKIYSVDYSWCFGPYALWKRLRYTSNYANQSTTSTVRAFLQTGGIGGAATGCVVAVSAPYSIPLLVISAVGGAAFTYWRNSADKENWTVERQIEYIQNCCAAHIHIQFKKKYKSEWCQDKLDKEIYDYLRKLLEKHRGQHIKTTNKNITALQKQLEKVKFDDNLSKEINRLEEFERIYLPENVESSSENEDGQKTENLETRNKPANFPCTVI